MSLMLTAADATTLHTEADIAAAVKKYHVFIASRQNRRELVIVPRIMHYTAVIPGLIWR